MKVDGTTEAGTIDTSYAGLLGSLGRGIRPGEREAYFLKPGYRSRERAEYFVDDLEGVVYQPDVYPLAVRIARAVDASILVDIGCGRAQKLVASAGSLETIGVDIGDNLDWCREHFPERRWLECDLDRPHTLAMSPRDLARSVLVCSDVIEHLVHPEHLLISLRAALEHAPALLLSTPERDLTWGLGHSGPPPNACHVREWNLAELARLLEHHGLPPRRAVLTRSDDQSSVMHTILAVVEGRAIRGRRPRTVAGA